MSLVAHLNDENFDAETAGKTCLVDFYAEWCGPCKMLAPVLDQIAEELGDEVLVAKVNVDEAQMAAKRFSVRTLPTVFVLKDGEIMTQFTGVQDKAALVDAIRSI